MDVRKCEIDTMPSQPGIAACIAHCLNGIVMPLQLHDICKQDAAALSSLVFEHSLVPLDVWQT